MTVWLDSASARAMCGLPAPPVRGTVYSFQVTTRPGETITGTFTASIPWEQPVEVLSHPDSYRGRYRAPARVEFDDPPPKGQPFEVLYSPARFR